MKILLIIGLLMSQSVLEMSMILHLRYLQLVRRLRENTQSPSTVLYHFSILRLEFKHPKSVIDIILQLSEHLLHEIGKWGRLPDTQVPWFYNANIWVVLQYTLFWQPDTSYIPAMISVSFQSVLSCPSSCRRIDITVVRH